MTLQVSLRTLALVTCTLGATGALVAGCADVDDTVEGELDAAGDDAQVDAESDGHDIMPGTPASEADDIPVEPGLFVPDALKAQVVDELTSDEAVDKKLFSKQPLAWVSDTTALPARTVTQLIVTHANGVMTRCSGTVVGPDAVLTNAHCVYNKGRGGWAHSIEVTPAKNGPNYRPYGRTWGRKLYCPQAYRDLDPNVQKVLHDYAIVHTHAKIGDTVGILEMVARPRQAGQALRLRGYPMGDYPHHMYTSADVVRKTYANQLFLHQASTLDGMSGAAALDGTNVFGIHVGEEPDGKNNDGLLFSSSMVSTLRSWATL